MRSGLNRLALAFFATAAATGSALAQASSPCTSDFPNPYRLDANWATTPRPFGPINAVTIDSKNNFWGVDR